MVWKVDGPDIYIFLFYIYFFPENYAPLRFSSQRVFTFFGGGDGRTPLFTTTCLLVHFAGPRKNAILPSRHNYPPSPDKNSSQTNVASFASVHQQMMRILLCYRFVTFCNQIVTVLLPFCNT